MIPLRLPWSRLCLYTFLGKKAGNPTPISHIACRISSNFNSTIRVDLAHETVWGFQSLSQDSVWETLTTADQPRIRGEAEYFLSG